MISINCLRISKFYLYEYFEKKIAYIFLFTSFLFLIFITSFTVFKMEMDIKVIKDFSISGIALINLLLVFSISLTSLTGDINNRYIYTLLSKPISKYDYIIGKFLSMACIILINIVLMIIELLVVTYQREGIFQTTIIWTGIFIFLEDCIIIAHIMLFSLIMPVTPNACLSLTMVIVGHMTPTYLTYLGKDEQFQISYVISNLLKLFLPHLYYFDIKTVAINSFYLPPLYAISAVAYGFVYISFILFLACWLMENKDI
jgi:ABC-type transport system involved in multi-copper enzyme maturation permease subunit